MVSSVVDPIPAALLPSPQRAVTDTQTVRPIIYPRCACAPRVIYNIAQLTHHSTRTFTHFRFFSAEFLVLRQGCKYVLVDREEGPKQQLDDCSGGGSKSAVATSYCCNACSSSSSTWLSGSGSRSSSHPSLNHA